MVLFAVVLRNDAEDLMLKRLGWLHRRWPTAAVPFLDLRHGFISGYELYRPCRYRNYGLAAVRVLMNWFS